MFRIHFQTKSGKWVIQLCRFEIFWATVKRSDSDHPQDRTFDTFDDANAHVQKLGLTKVYRWQGQRPRFVSEMEHGAV